MMYALRSPRIRLSVRRELAQRIRECESKGKPYALKDHSDIVFVWGDTYPAGFCIYCNTSVRSWTDIGGPKGFRHLYSESGIDQGLCRQIAKCLGMEPVYGVWSFPEER